VLSAAEYHAAKPGLLPVVLDALAGLRDRFDVVLCEGAGSPAEINLLDGDLVNLPLARAAGLPAVVVGDIDRGGVFASLYGTVALLPDDLRATVRGFVINRLRGDPALLGNACADLERRCGIPTLGVLPHLGVVDIDNEDSLALDRPPPPIPAGGATTPETRWTSSPCAGPGSPTRATWTRCGWSRASTSAGCASVPELGRPDLVVLPGSKNTRGDLDWFRSHRAGGRGRALGAPRWWRSCAGCRWSAGRSTTPTGVEGPAGGDQGLGWLSVTTSFEGDKVLDRPTGHAAGGPGQGHQVAGYRIHHGRVRAESEAAPAVDWWRTEARCWAGTPGGWWARRCTACSEGRVPGRGPGLGGGAVRKQWSATGVDFAAARMERLDRIADALEAHLDLAALATLIAEGAP
jgi:adenosylcobyric acid synthase